MNQDKIRDALEINMSVEKFLLSEDITREHLAKLLHGSNKIIREYLNEENEE